jgi:hypothetical protein
MCYYPPILHPIIQKEDISLKNRLSDDKLILNSISGLIHFEFSW